MSDLVKYIVSGLKSKQFSKESAMDLIKLHAQESTSNNKNETIHPLVQKNTSDVYSQRYRSRFTGKEFFLADHKVAIENDNILSVLPGVAYIEMARAAVCDAVPEMADSASIRIGNVVWVQPLVVNEAVEVDIVLVPVEDGIIQFRIIHAETSPEHVYCSGEACLTTDIKPINIDVGQLKNRLETTVFETQEIYRLFEEMGLVYGKGHQGISKLYSDGSEVLAQLTLPETIDSNLYVLHPGLMDSALQGIIGINTGEQSEGQGPSIPFALESLHILSQCKEHMFAWIRPSNTPVDDGSSNLDIDLVGSDGRVCIQLSGFASRTITTSESSSINSSVTQSIVEQQDGLLISNPVWNEKALSPMTQGKAEATANYIFCAGLTKARYTALGKADSESNFYNLNLATNKKFNAADYFLNAATIIFDELKNVFQEKIDQPVMIQVLVTNHKKYKSLLGLTGFLKTLNAENPNIMGQVILADTGNTNANLLSILQSNRQSPSDTLLKYQGEKRLTREWNVADYHAAENSSSGIFSNDGCYLITGGLGGIGLVFAKEILEQSAHSKIILTGRSPLNDEKKNLVDSLNSNGRIDYQVLNNSNKNDVSDFFANLANAKTKVTGILHCAGITEDEFFIKKELQQFTDVLAPKVQGTCHLDYASKDLDLDFFILFSSGVSVFGNAGQSDYAAANGFMDYYAAQRSALVKAGERKGRSLAINWPLWEEGGMKLDSDSQSLLEQLTGMRPIRTQSALVCFYQSLWSDYSQVLVMEGNVNKMKTLFDDGETTAQSTQVIDPVAKSDIPRDKPVMNQGSVDDVDSQVLHKRAEEFLKQEFSTIFKMPVSQIESKTEFENYGINSIMAMNLTAQLEKSLGTLSKTLFFEYTNISDLTTYIVNKHEGFLRQDQEQSIDAPTEVTPSQNTVDSPDNKSLQERSNLNGRASPVSFRKLAPASANTSRTKLANEEAIAIVGLSGRYPKSPDLNEFWKNLSQGVDCITEIPSDRWEWRDYDSGNPNAKGIHTSKWGGFINGVDEFDPIFFNISPREAEHIDPQERLFLQHAWMAMEDAGFTRADLQAPQNDNSPGQVGVYVGVMYGEYNLSGSLASIANRVSYVLNIQGPSITLDTMCSSSLSAIHIACQDLKLGRTDMAIAGGVNVSVHPSKYSMLSAGQFISRDGHCQSFGEGGDGYIPSEGVGAVMLKRLSDAEQTDHIYAVIKASALNHGGKTNGYTVPNPRAQASVITRAFREANIDPRQVSYIEAHGTGTKLGDPIEVAALNRAFGEQGADTDSINCLLGSAKSNIGHCESAAGIAGLTKILLQMEHELVVPSLHSESLNPNIDFDESPFTVNQSLTPWNRPVIEGKEHKRVAGLSSFGAGGSNAHLVIEEYMAVGLNVQDNYYDQDGKLLFPLSARTSDQLQQKIEALHTFINDQRDHSELELSSLAFTLQLGREALEERIAYIAGSIDELALQLKTSLQEDKQSSSFFRGTLKEHKQTLTMLSTDSDFLETCEKWISGRKFNKLAELWVKGFDVEWNKLYGESKPRRMALPTYPFAKERYWIDPRNGMFEPAKAEERSRQKQSTELLHPLLHRNTSTFDNQSYELSLLGNELFLRNRIDGEKMVMPFCYFEMARVAFLSAQESDACLVDISDVNWGAPALFSDGPQNINVSLVDEFNEVGTNASSISVDIYTNLEGGEHVLWQAKVNKNSSISNAEKLDLRAIQGRLKASQSPHKHIESLYQSDTEFVAKLNLSTLESGFGADFKTVVNPVYLERLFSLAGDLIPELNSPETQLYPKSLNRLTIVQALSESMYYRVKVNQDSLESSSLDVYCYDNEERLCMRFLGLHVIALPNGDRLVEQREFVNYTVETRQIIAKPASVALLEPDLQDGLVLTNNQFKPNGLALAGLSEKLSVVSLGSLGAEGNSEINKPKYEPVGQEFDASEKRETDYDITTALSLQELEHQLVSSLADALYMDVSDIELDKSFVDLGLDSIVGVEWVNVINKTYQLEVSATRVYDYSNVLELATYINQELSDNRVEPAISELEVQRVDADLKERDVSRLPAGIPASQHSTPYKSTQELQIELQQSLALALYLPLDEVDVDKSFIDLGLDSIVGVEWVHTLNKQYHLDISATKLYDFSNVVDLTSYIGQALADTKLLDDQIPTETQIDVEVVNGKTQLGQDKRPSEAIVNSSSIDEWFPILTRTQNRIKRKIDGESLTEFELHVDPPQAKDKVAIIGISGRYPQASNLDEYWGNLLEGKNSVTEVPAERWDVNRYYDSESKDPEKIYCKWLGALDDIDCFDPMFFQISPSEAEVMDPQHRLFMQEGYHAFEDAGYCRKTLSSQKVGVYLGIMSSEYSFVLSGADTSHVNTTGNSFAIGAARIAYYLNLKGPAIPVDTACSSSLVAMHLGCQALLNHEIDMALAGGVSLYLVPESYQGMCQAGMLSPDGQCKTFDDSANGFVPGEGVGAVVLKRLADAEHDKDTIHGVILGSAINQDGKTNGITAPSVNSQIELERDFYSRYQINPDSISYVEAHGTGTKLGDPIEVEALSTVFGEQTEQKQYCSIGSVKSNIGHTSGAAGVASIHKVLLSMRHQTLVPSLNFAKENAHFSFEKSPFYIQQDRQPWQSESEKPRRAAISAFGFSGTNAHVVIEEYIADSSTELGLNELDGQLEYLIPLSARSSEQLQKMVENLQLYLQPHKLKNDQRLLRNLAYTFQVGRDEMKERIVFIAHSIDELVENIAHYLEHSSTSARVFRSRISQGKGAISIPEGFSSLDEAAAGLLKKKSLSDIAELWIKGLQFDWDKLHGDYQPSRISLPTYPFLRDSYWVQTDKADQVIFDDPTKPITTSNEVRSKTYFTTEWQEQTLAIHPISDEQAIKTILLIDNCDELYLSFKELREKHGNSFKLYLLKTHQETNIIDDCIFHVEPDDEVAVKNVIDKVLNENTGTISVVHCCPEVKVDTDIDCLLEHSLYTLLSVVKTIMTSKSALDFRVVSTYSNINNERRPAYEALGGFLRTLTLENSQYQSKLVNFCHDAELTIDSSLHALTLLDELNEVAWSSGEVRHQFEASKNAPLRYRRTFAQKQLDSFSNRQHLPLKHSGVYLITGGLGGLGIIFAKYLISHFDANVVLVGRSSLSEEQIKEINELAPRDKQVSYLSADITDSISTQRLIQQVSKSHKVINGIIHSAGITHDALIINKTKSSMQEVLAPKVQGTINLDQATLDIDLDFFVVFSSGSGAMGNVAQSDYAYANYFLDSFSEQRAALQLEGLRQGKSLSIAWPFWQEGGMSVSSDVLSATEKRSGMSVLPTVEGIQYFEDYLCSDLSLGLALYGFIEKIPAYMASLSEAKLDSDASVSLAFDDQHLIECTSAYIKKLIEAETKIPFDAIDEYEPFDAFGFDSIIIGRLNAILEEDLGELPKTLMYEYVTVGEMTTYLVQRHTSVLARFFSVVTDSGNEVSSKRQSPTESVIVAQNAVSSSSQKNEAIAVIGLHGYYPDAENQTEFWNKLKNGKDLVQSVPEDRWDYKQFYDPDPENAQNGKIYCKWGSFISHFDRFDAEFFNIPRNDANMIDPQERLFLQSVWSTIEDAGYTRESLKHYFPKERSASVGVFVGVTTNSYELFTTDEWRNGNAVAPSSKPWSIANRVSYFFDFQGPSIPVDTACSSSLVALHLACESLRNNQCQAAIAGGVNLYLHPSKYQSFCQKQMVSTTGQNRSFGAGDDGFVPGEAIGSVMLKPLTKAEQDGDHIYGVILGSGYEHSGRANGYSAPNPNAQAKLIEATLRNSSLTAEDISYVEGHGTGTQLGDSLEIVALNQAFNKTSEGQQSCAIGSVKSNMGHAESAAGMAGLTKVLMQLKHRMIAPSINAQQINPNIDFGSSHFHLQDELSAWVSNDKTKQRRALINAIGAGGVNACLIVEEYADQSEEQIISCDNDEKPSLFVVSAKDLKRLKQYTANIRRHISNAKDISLTDLCYTLQIGREVMSERLAIIASSKQHLLGIIDKWLKNPSDESLDGELHYASLDASVLVKKAGEKIAQEKSIKACEAGDVSMVAKLWIEGVKINWQNLSVDGSPKRLSLPTYPFAKDRYWMSDKLTISGVSDTAKQQNSITPIQLFVDNIHPLISKNISTIKSSCFSSYLSSDAYYTKDHTVNGEPTFPGAGFLEMACIAGSIAAEKRVSHIKDLVWVQPLSSVKMQLPVRTFLVSNGDELEFRISSTDPKQGNVVHSEGRLIFEESSNQFVHDKEARIDIALIMKKMTGTISKDQWYEDFSKLGVDYGPSFRTVSEFSFTKDASLAKLVLPENLKGDFDDYILHPSILDGALQTVLGLFERTGAGVPYLPFAIDDIAIYRALSTQCYVYTQRTKNSNSSSGLSSVDISIFSLNGNLIAKIFNFYVRPVNTNSIAEDSVGITA